MSISIEQYRFYIGKFNNISTPGKRAEPERCSSVTEHKATDYIALVLLLLTVTQCIATCSQAWNQSQSDSPFKPQVNLKYTPNVYHMTTTKWWSCKQQDI